MVQLIYPETKLVAWSTLWGWYRDAETNGEISEDYHGITCRGMEDNWHMLEALEDAGLVTSQRSAV